MMAVLRKGLRGVVSVAMFANMAGTALIFLLVAILNADVIARGVFHAPFRGVVELVIFSLVLIVFLQLPDVVFNNRLTRSDGFLNILSARKPRAGLAISGLIDFVAGVFMAMAAWTMWPEFFESLETCSFFTTPEFGAAATGDFITDLRTAWGRCEYAGTPGIFTAPVWPVKLAIAFSVTLCAVLFFAKTAGLDRSLDDEANAPIAGQGT